jgi:hypothetical protein
VGVLVLRVALVPSQACPAVTATAIDEAVAGSAAWIERALREDGSYVYEYDRDTGELSPFYNEVRHAGVTMSLYQLAAAGDLSVLPAADAALERMIGLLYREDDWAAIRNPGGGSIQLGASALMLAGLGQRRLATDDTLYDDLMREVGRFIVAMQAEDGSFYNYWDASTGAPDPSVKSRYATGEAFWALTLMHEAFPGEGWDVPAWKVSDYLALYRDEAEGFEFPPWADQWAAYGLAEMAGWGLHDYHIAYARSLAERFGFLIRAESQRDGSAVSEFLRGRNARAAGMGTWVEGLTSLWRLSVADARMADLRPDIEERMICGAAMLVDRQVTAETAGRRARPTLLQGAWFTKGVTRMDDQQHALSGLLRSREVVAAREGAGE